MVLIQHKIGGSTKFAVADTGAVAALSLALASPPAADWNIDGTASAITVPANGNAILAVGSGAIILTDVSATGTTGMYLTGGNVAAFVAGIGGAFVATTTAPAANTYSIAYNGTNYAIYNGRAAAVTFNLIMLKTRAAN